MPQLDLKCKTYLLSESKKIALARVWAHESWFMACQPEEKSGESPDACSPLSGNAASSAIYVGQACTFCEILVFISSKLSEWCDI